MFWRFGGYANISTIDTILEKDNFQLEDLLSESDLIQELKSHNPKLVEYLREPNVLERLLEYVVAPRLEPMAAPENDEYDDEGKGKGLALPFSRPRLSSRLSNIGEDEEEAERKRNTFASVSAEILSSDNWSIFEALMENRHLIRSFWRFLKRPTPLDPLQASYFTKVNESLFDKKTEEMLELLKSLDGAVPDMLKHVDCPMVMDLLLKIISLERTESGQGIWLYTQDVMPTLLSFLGPEHSWATQTSAGDFMKAIITVSANASQNEQACIGPNELTRQLVSKPCVERLIKYMLGGGNPLTCGVGIVIEVIRKNNSDYDPDGPDANSIPSSRDPIYLGTLLRLFAQHVPDFMNLIMHAPAQKERLTSTFGEKIEPLGFDRFKTCELMAELLHCSNMGLLNEVGSEELIAARDAERQRLRAEGRLLPVRGEEAPSSAEDLTMRISHSSPVEEGRKLGVVNSSVDDDGFEEVTHAAEEDTSHGVEELPEVPAPGPTSSFLDKDEDDFVDEPLSSPRLNVREIEVHEIEKEKELQPFADPDLMVPPLSPTKKKTADDEDSSPAAESTEVQSEETTKDTADPSQPKIEVSGPEKTEPEAAENDESEKSDQTETPLLTPTTSEPDVSKPEELAARIEEQIRALPESLSPHPEDTPAPLFSGTGASAAPAPSSTQAETSAPSDQTTTPKDAGSAAQTSAVEPNTAEPGTEEVSIIVGHVSGPTTPIDSSPINPKPVVGDYLKMQFVEYRVVPTILGFFFTYPWNNFLHNVVYDIVQQVFNGPMDRGYNPTLAISLFESADITNQIIDGQLASERSQAKNKTRMGYMGHLTLIAEEVVKFTERHPPELLSESVLEKVMAQEWINYVEGALAETRERDNAILGGVRPEVAMSNRAANASGLASIGLTGGLAGLNLGNSGGSSALAEAGLHGGQEQSESSQHGPFAISAGTLMSGFGSSSDEDDEEEQDNEEDVANEFRAYTDPLNAHSNNALNPPSIPPPPPPPPPLNIPPSRARLQLAARLAMNKRKSDAEAAAANGQEGAFPPSNDATGSATFSPPSTSANERLLNPFADDDDDDDDDGSGSGSGSGSDDGEIGNGDNDGVGSNSWNRGSWWRGVVRSARRGSGRRKDPSSSGDKTGSLGAERFGDGRDDDSEDSDRAGDGEDDVDAEMDDEEFGDFAMPEVGGSNPNSGAREGGAAAGGGGLVSGIDPAREKILLKPLAVHPTSIKSSASPFGSLWPFSSQGFGVKEKEKSDAAGEKQPSSEEKRESTDTEKINDEPVQLEQAGKIEDEGVVGEDGKKIDRAIEAKRRTSIEDPDEDEVDVGEEIIVGRSGLD
ncbi:Extragenic suppressor of kinetochore protein 1 [Diplogelasinospora grovesii]|uniref:Extragenic suppressor of kinetochore protein 1 n=1 Tax=Diplogelasinospora grovesii TaxID=303347 RepID=A0AAN6MXD7_9PEZI|nr:Extragenic suppressor of kinetochore protein 1 [Diplogelasinospora grovesii]